MSSMFCPAGGDPACPYCIENVSGRANHKGHVGYHRARRGREPDLSRFIRPAAPVNGLTHAPPEADPSDFFAHYPALYEFLTLVTWPEGGARETATLTLFQGPDGCQAALNDRDSGMVAFCTAKSFTALLGALDEGLSGGSLSWRVSKGRIPQRKK